MSAFCWLLPDRLGGSNDHAGSADVERVVERLAEDEALRGDLTDEGYGPLLAVVADLVVARGERFAVTDDLYVAARRLLVGAVEAASAADVAPLLECAETPLLSQEERSILASTPVRAGVPADRAAALIAGRLAEATGLGGGREQG